MYACIYVPGMYILLTSVGSSTLVFLECSQNHGGERIATLEQQLFIFGDAGANAFARPHHSNEMR